GAGRHRTGGRARGLPQTTRRGRRVSVEDRLAELGLALPPVSAPVAAYVPAVVSGHLVFTAGQLPFAAGVLPAAGKVGAEVGADEAFALTQTAALNGLAAASEAIGSLARVTRVVKVTVFVASTPDFTGQPAVANGASE